MANGLFGGGNGSTTAPYLVEDAEDLNAVRNRVSAHYRQVADIDFAEFGTFTPLGTSSSNPFTGSYEGNNFKIKNINIAIFYTGTANNSFAYGGVFGYVASPGIIQNIHVENGNITNTGNGFRLYVGGIVGHHNSGDLNNCSFKGNININQSSGGSSGIGGIVGDMEAGKQIYNCSFEGDLIGRSNNNSVIVGGIVGASITCHNCRVKGTIYGYHEVNGITGGGARDCIVEDSHISYTISSSTAYKASGISGGTSQRCKIINSEVVGYVALGIGSGGFDCSVINCRITANGSSGGYAVGAFANNSTFEVSRTVVKDTIVSGYQAYGIAFQVSSSTTTISDCAFIGGEITSNSSVAGIGHAGNSGAIRILRCYCSGNVTGSGSFVGGILGGAPINGSVSSYVRNSFFLGEFVKGLGAQTSNIGLISGVPLSGNQNNYSLDTSQIILE